MHAFSLTLLSYSLLFLFNVTSNLPIIMATSLHIIWIKTKKEVYPSNWSLTGKIPLNLTYFRLYQILQHFITSHSLSIPSNPSVSI